MKRDLEKRLTTRRAPGLTAPIQKSGMGLGPSRCGLRIFKRSLIA